MDICPTADGKKKEGKRDCGLLLAVAGRRVRRLSVSFCPHSECEKKGAGLLVPKRLRSVPRRGGPKRGYPLHAPNQLRFSMGLENDSLSPKKTEVGGPLENCGF